MTIAGASLFFYHLDKGGLNIDFTGGTAYAGQLTEPVSMVELRNMLDKSDLPDLSIEQTFVNSDKFVQGDKSKLFTVRTSEKDRNKVLQSINTLLGNNLHKTDLQSYEIDQAGKKDATLAFVEPGTNKPAFASLAQVNMLLTEELDKAGLTLAAQQFTLEGLGKEEEGRFQWMHLQFMQPVDGVKLQSVLENTQAAFAAMPQPERLENFDSQLASETQKRALYAILASWAAILLYLWFRFGSWTFGLAAVVCLIVRPLLHVGVDRCEMPLHPRRHAGSGQCAAHPGLQDRPSHGGSIADAGRLLGERHHCGVRSNSRSSGQEPRADAANDQRQR